MLRRGVRTTFRILLGMLVLFVDPLGIHARVAAHGPEATGGLHFLTVWRGTGGVALAVVGARRSGF